MQDPHTPTPDDWDEEDADRDLKEFAFYAKLEENGGKPTKGLYVGGCFFILPLVFALSAILFFLMNRFY